MINSKLEDIQKKKIGLKRKAKQGEVETELTREYLDRIYEFFDVFGGPDQLNEYEMVYPDIINDASDQELEPALKYFE